MDKSLLGRWRSLDAVVVLAAIADRVKQDPTFVPVKASDTTRWHASIAGLDLELLLTGPKFFDTRAGMGGGGAIDLVMHLTQSDFKTATQVLSRLQI